MANFPRSPYDTAGGLFHFARMLDKARLAHRGELPAAYAPMLGNGFDGRLCRFLGIPYSQVQAWAIESDDDEAIARRCFNHGRRLTEEEKLIWNSFVSKRGWRDDETADYIPDSAHESGLDDDGSVLTDFDLLQLEEGRALDEWIQAWAEKEPRVASPLPKRVQRLARLARRHLRPLDPLPTGTAANLRPIPGIRSVVFDLYGTLFISASGDISLADERRAASEDALRDALATLGVELPSAKVKLHDRFLDCIQAARSERAAEGVDFPEVDIRDVWETFLDGMRGEFRWEPGVVHRERIEALAVDYECRVNPVWSMPNLSESLAWLSGEGRLLGIVSNAQFYTRALFPALLGQPLRNLGFSLDCCVFSYRKRVAKPSLALYQDLAERLARRGVRPDQTLYVGNDMRNDIRPASELGFRTALFAGDARSLRWRKEDRDADSITPDAVITDLFQLIEVLRSS